MNFTGENKNETVDASDRTIVIINSALNAPLMLISILGNALVLAAVRRTPAIHSPSMTFLYSLAVSDLLVGLIVQPLYIANTLTNIHVLKLLAGMMAFFVCGVSLDTITAISVDRLIALLYHLRYATMVTASRVRYTIVAIWFTKVLSSGFYLWKKRECHLITAVTTVICLIISTFSYIKIYLIVRHHQSQIHIQQQTVQGSANEGHHMARLKRSAINTFLFYIFLIICYFPMYILSTLHGISYMNWVTQWDFAHTAVFMNSAINPILYCWRLRELRRAIVKTIRETFYSQTEQH
ncbi:melanocyte-stimulating hormone receptor-like [Oculina patagonica]